MAHERREAGLAPPAMHLLAEHRAVERERDLAGERADGGALGLRRVRLACNQKDRRLGPARRERDGEKPCVRRRQACGERLRHDKSRGRLALRRGLLQALELEGLTRGRVPVRARGGHAQRPGVVEAAQRDGCAGRGERGGSAHGDSVDLRAFGGRNEIRPRAAERALTLERPVLLADEAGHSHDDETEEQDRRRAHGRVVEIAGPEIVDDADRGRHQRRARQQRQPEGGEHDLAPGRRLVEPSHRRMQPGRAPEEIRADPPGVEPELVVVQAVKRQEPVGEVGDKEQHDAGRQQVERRLPATRVEREPDDGADQDDVTDRIRHRDDPAQQRQVVLMKVGRHQRDPRRQ